VAPVDQKQPSIGSGPGRPRARDDHRRAITGSILANLMFALPAVDFSAKDRAAGQLWFGEVVATTGLILLIFALAGSGRTGAGLVLTEYGRHTGHAD
jgi:hypothetical protein